MDICVLNSKGSRRVKTSMLLAGVCLALLACSSGDDDRTGATVNGGGKRMPAMNPNSAGSQSQMKLPPSLPAADTAANSVPSPAPVGTVPPSLQNASGPYTPQYKTENGFFDSGLLDRMFGPSSSKDNDQMADNDTMRQVPVDNPGSLQSDEMSAATVPVTGSDSYPQLSSVPPAPVLHSSAAQNQQNMDALVAARAQSETQRQSLAGDPVLEQQAAASFGSAPYAPYDIAPYAPPAPTPAEMAVTPVETQPWEAQIANSEPAAAAPSYAGSVPREEGGFGGWLSGLFGEDEDDLPPPRQRLYGNVELTNQAVPVAPVESHQQAIITPAPSAPVYYAPQPAMQQPMPQAYAAPIAPRSTFAAAPQIDPVPANVSNPPPVQTMADAPIQLTPPVDSGRYLMLTPPSQVQERVRTLPDSRYAVRRMSTYR